MRPLILALLSFSLAACFAPVTEVQCLRDADCDAGVCLNNVCTTAGSGGGSATGGGSMGGGTTGGGATGGGTTGGGTTGGGATGGGATGGGATGGGTTGGGAGGGGGTCGCRDALGMCRTGDSPLACGAGGATCQACGFGEQCISGRCAMGACGPMSCNGCCTNNFCVTVSQQTRFACGSGGAMCTQCGMGQTCLNGVCGTPTCDPTNCPSGCCNNGVCEPGTSRFACGARGQTCVRCTMGTQCQQGLCVGGGFDGGFPNPDAGMGVPAGSPCTTATQCQPPQAAFCIQESIAGQTTGYAGGYCTQTCGMGTGGCGLNAMCVTETFFGASQSTCRATCTAPGTQSTCRQGYVCQPSTLSIAPGFCRARCDSGGVLSGCPQGQTCNMTTGVCG